MGPWRGVMKGGAWLAGLVSALTACGHAALAEPPELGSPVAPAGQKPDGSSGNATISDETSEQARQTDNTSANNGTSADAAVRERFWTDGPLAALAAARCADGGVVVACRDEARAWREVAGALLRCDGSAPPESEAAQAGEPGVKPPCGHPQRWAEVIRAAPPDAAWRSLLAGVAWDRACLPRLGEDQPPGGCRAVLEAVVAGAPAVAIGVVDGLPTAEPSPLGTTAWPVAALLEVRPLAVGVLLPLTGSYGHVGTGALEALKLAFEGIEGLSLEIRDTAGDGQRAAAMARELAADARVVAILGPVGRLETAESLAVTRRVGLPHIVLGSQLERLSSSSGAIDTAIRVRTSPEDLARAVARHAVLEVGLRRLAVLKPEEPNDGAATSAPSAADRQAAAFVDEVVRLGAAHVRTVGHEQDSKDYRLAAEALLGRSAGAGARRDVQADFDGLFIPDSAARVRRLIPFLEYAGLTPRTRPRGAGVQLLGGAGWNHASVIDRGNSLTDNAIFADAWFGERAAAEGPGSFSRRFEAVARQKPGPFHAEVFDAARLLGVALMGAVATSAAVDAADARRSVLQRLLTASPQAGVTGILAFAAGEPVPRSRLLTVHGDLLRERVSEEEEAALREATPAGLEARPPARAR
jgi:ABC-type branched-subunit amino acid transport system substrate-binding protein